MRDWNLFMFLVIGLIIKGSFTPIWYVVLSVPQVSASAGRYRTRSELWFFCRVGKERVPVKLEDLKINFLTISGPA